MRVSWLAILFGTLAFVRPSAALAAPGRACGEAYVEGQELRSAGKLIPARERLLRCTQLCTGTFMSECHDWLRDVEARIPSIVIRALGPDGADVAGIRVSVDGTASTRPEGAPIELDVGRHRVKVVADGYTPLERELVAVEGESRRLVTVTLAREVRVQEPAAKPPEEPPQEPKAETGSPTTGTRALPWTVLALGGVAVASAAVFGTFALMGDHIRGDLDGAGCKPYCDASRVDAFRRDYLVADIALGTAVVAAGVAIVLYVTRPTRPAASRPLFVHSWSASSK
jgi:hypothetical protein